MPLFEAKNRLSELLDRVQAGEVVAITRHGRLCAHLTPPPQDEATTDPAAEVFARLTALRQRLDLDEDWKVLARAGLRP